MPAKSAQQSPRAPKASPKASRNATRSRSPRRRRIRLFSDCSGMSSISHAFYGLGLRDDMVHVGACDKDTTAKKFWMNNYGETRWYDDIFGRNYRAIMNQPLTPN
eukprot:1063-Pyramimonas_sp.AAC.1